MADARFIVLVCVSLASALQCDCGNDVNDQHDNMGPLLTPDDERQLLPLRPEPGSPLDVEAFSMAGNTTTGEGPTSCICKRQRKPNRPIKCNKKGLENDSTSDDDCEEFLLDPEVGKPAVRLVIKLGIRPTVDGTHPIAPQTWYDTWTATYLTVVAMSTTVDVAHMSVVLVTEIPQSVDIQIIVRDERAADIVITGLNRAIDTLGFDAQIQNAGYPGKPACRILSIRASQLSSYDPAIHRLIHFVPSGPHGVVPVPGMIGNHTTGNHTHIGMLSGIAEVQRKVANLVKVNDGFGDETPLMLKSIADTFESRQDKQKMAPRLRIPMLVRTRLVGFGNSREDSMTVPEGLTAPEMGTILEVKPPVLPPTVTEELIVDRITRLINECSEVVKEESNLQQNIDVLRKEYENVKASV